MKRLNEALSESVGSESGEVALQRGEAEHALLSCEESLGKKFDSRLGGALKTGAQAEHVYGQIGADKCTCAVASLSCALQALVAPRSFRGPRRLTCCCVPTCGIRSERVHHVSGEFFDLLFFTPPGLVVH